VPSWRETTPHASSTAAIDALDTLAPPLLTRLSPLDETRSSYFEPRLIEDIYLICKYEIFFGDQDDGVLGRFGRGGRGGVKVLIAFNAPTHMGGSAAHAVDDLAYSTLRAFILLSTLFLKCWSALQQRFGILGAPMLVSWGDPSNSPCGRRLAFCV